MSHLYNDIEPNAQAWLKELIFAGELPWGDVDGRSIKAINGGSLKGITQFHTFAGIGGWPLALKLAGWPEDREVWTGSCPCQPYSSAGKQKGNADERNLWPDFFRLIAARRPKFVFGEQVASAIKHGWLDRVYADLEGIGYTVGAAVLGAHSVGANHIRQRLYWGAALRGSEHAAGLGRVERGTKPSERSLERGCGGGGVASEPEPEPERGRGVRRDEGDTGELEPQGEVAGLGVGGGVSDNERGEREGGLRGPDSSPKAEGLDSPEQLAGHSSVRTPWSDFRYILCTDGKARRTGARVFPLAYGLRRGVGDGGSWRKGLARGASRARIGMLKGSGNAIVPELAAQFIMAFQEALGEI